MTIFVKIKESKNRYVYQKGFEYDLTELEDYFE